MAPSLILPDNPEKVEKEWKIMRKTAERLKRNFNFLRKQKGKLSPWEMNIFRFLPLPFLAIMTHKLNDWVDVAASVNFSNSTPRKNNAQMYYSE